MQYKTAFFIILIVMVRIGNNFNTGCKLIIEVLVYFYKMWNTCSVQIANI
jgi:hypothetical protein